MELSDFLAALAIIISIGCAIWQWQHDLRINAVNLEAEYFHKIYEQHLLYEIPNARKYVFFRNNRLQGYEVLINELNGIRNDSLYFLYSDKNFYEKLKSVLWELEVYLGTCANQELTGSNQELVMSEIQEKIENIYDTIIRKYHGRRG